MSGGEGGGFTPDDGPVPWPIRVAVVVSALLIFGGLIYGLVAVVRWVVS